MSEEKLVQIRMTFRRGGLLITFDPLHLVAIEITEVSK